MAETKTRKIHKGLSIELVKNKAKLRAYCICVDLAQLTANRSIHNYEKRLEALANTLGIHVKTLKKYLKLILEQGWATIQGSSLNFTGRWKVAKLIGDCSRKGHWQIEARDFKELELHIRAIAIEENKIRQHESINKKLIAREVKKAKIFCKVIKKKFAKTVNVKLQRDKLRAVNVVAPINKEVTLSREGVARLYGNTSANSGMYWVKKLKKNLPFIFTDEWVDDKWLGKMSRDYFNELKEISNRSLYMKDGICYCRRPNYVAYSLPTAAPKEIAGLQSTSQVFPQ